MRTDKRKRTTRRSLQHGVRRWEITCQLVSGGAIVTYPSAATVQEAKEQTKRELGTALKRITKARESA